MLRRDERETSCSRETRVTEDYNVQRKPRLKTWPAALCHVDLREIVCVFPCSSMPRRSCFFRWSCCLLASLYPHCSDSGSLTASSVGDSQTYHPHTGVLQCPTSLLRFYAHENEKAETKTQIKIFLRGFTPHFSIISSLFSSPSVRWRCSPRHSCCRAKQVQFLKLHASTLLFSHRKTRLHVRLHIIRDTYVHAVHAVSIACSSTLMFPTIYSRTTRFSYCN